LRIIVEVIEGEVRLAQRQWLCRLGFLAVRTGVEKLEAEDDFVHVVGGIKRRRLK